MDIRHLEYFVAVAKLRSFTKASQFLHVTQPSISKMVRALEEELGVTLLFRSAKSVELTDAGKAVFNQAQHILSSFQNLTLELGDVITVQKGNLHIGLPPIASSSFFPSIIGQFKQAYPNISIQLFEVGSKSVESGVEEGTLDIGIVCTLPARTDIFAMFPFVQDPLMVIVHPSHPLATESVVEFEQLRTQPFVLYREDFSLHDHIIERCLQTGFQPKVICSTSQRDFMTEMVAANLGVALLPRKICLELDPARIKAIDLAPPSIYLHLAVIWKKGRYLSFAARKLLEFTSSLMGVSLNSAQLREIFPSH